MRDKKMNRKAKCCNTITKLSPCGFGGVRGCEEGDSFESVYSALNTARFLQILVQPIIWIT